MEETGKKTLTGERILIDDTFKVGEIIPSERTRSLTHLALCELRHPESKGVAFDCGMVICINGRTAMRIGGTFGTKDNKLPNKNDVLNVMCRIMRDFIHVAQAGKLGDFTEQEKYQLFGTQENRRR